MRRFLTMTLAAVATSAGLVAASTAPQANAAYRDDLTISPSYNDTTTLQVDTYEDKDALPEYTFRLRVVDGPAVPVGCGYAEDTASDSIEGPYSVDTQAPLTSGVTYEAVLRVVTTGYWGCSIYDPDGCSFIEGSSVTQRWRFKYNGGTMKATRYIPSSKIVVGTRQPWRDRGWRITATLRREDGSALARQLLTGQYRVGNGRWNFDDSFRTDDKGRLILRFYGERTRTSYRFVFDGNVGARKAISRAVNITARR